MKVLNTRNCLLIWWLLSVSLQSVNADTVVTIPENPGPYESFVIEVSSDQIQTVPWAVDIVINSGNISIRYLRDSNGFLAPAIPLEVVVSGLPPGEYDINVEEVKDNAVSFGQVTIADAPPALPAYGMFLSAPVAHYFVTADENERDQVLDSDWGYVVDDGFNVWPADGPAPEAALPVCRFYSSLVNSHFYTASEEECDYLQSFDSGWEYEGIAFRALIPTAGACATGTTPVWRLYNNRAAEQDSNHRFVASSETYRTMIADGWVGEGVAFCSPPSAIE